MTDDNKTRSHKPDHARQLEILDRISSTVVGDLRLDTIVQEVTDCATEMTGAKFGAFFYNVLNDQGESYLLYALRGAPREAFEKFRMPRNTAVFDHTFRGLGIVRSDDIRLDPRYGQNAPHKGIPTGHLPVVSYLAAPVKSRTGEIIGGLFFGHPMPGVFTSDDEKMAARVASRAGLAIDNARLLQAAQQLAAIVESSDDAIVSKDLKGIIKSWNRGAERIFGYAAAETVGRPVTMLIPDEYQHEEPEILRRISAGERIEHYETVRQRKDGTRFPVSLTVSPIRDRGNAIAGASKIARDITESKQAQEQRDVLMREMHHRIKNLFAVASGIVALSSRNATSAPDLARSIQERLTAMAHAHELTLPNSAGTSDVFRPASFQELARAVLSPYERPGDDHVIALSGPPKEVGPQAATSLALLLHEFATNSVKYGALSNDQGKISLDWAEQGDMLLRWKETGGPKIVAPPQTEGFGAILSELTAANLRGAIRRTWAPTGLEIEVKFPSSALDH